MPVLLYSHVILQICHATIMFFYSGSALRLLFFTIVLFKRHIIVKFKPSTTIALSLYEHELLCMDLLNLSGATHEEHYSDKTMHVTMTIASQ